MHGHKSLVAPFGGAEPRFTTNPYCTAVPRKGKEPIVLDFATSQVAAGKVRVANNKKVQMEEGLLIDAAGHPTTDPGVLYNAPYGAILPFGLHKGGGLAVICDLLAGALTGGRTHSPRTIKKDRHRHHQQHAVDHHRPRLDGRHRVLRGRGRDLHHLGEVGPSRSPASLKCWRPASPSAPAAPIAKGMAWPIDTTTWQQLIDVARKVRLNDTEIPHTVRA